MLGKWAGFLGLRFASTFRPAQENSFADFLRAPSSCRPPTEI